jgi:hypothetical protein
VKGLLVDKWLLTGLASVASTLDVPLDHLGVVLCQPRAVIISNRATTATRFPNMTELSRRPAGGVLSRRV